jgi:hypothetical protein
MGKVGEGGEAHVAKANYLTILFRDILLSLNMNLFRDENCVEGKK